MGNDTVSLKFDNIATGLVYIYKDGLDRARITGMIDFRAVNSTPTRPRLRCLHSVEDANLSTIGKLIPLSFRPSRR
jgi:hypothetical protein